MLHVVGTIEEQSGMQWFTTVEESVAHLDIARMVFRYFSRKQIQGHK